MTKRQTTETIQIPESTAIMIRHRCADLVRRSMYDTNIIDSIALSCYAQGLADAFQVIEHRPSLIEELRAPAD
jgi:hypothetical protein